MDAHAQTEQGIQKGLGSPQAPGECFRGRSACANLQECARKFLHADGRFGHGGFALASSEPR